MDCFATLAVTVWGVTSRARGDRAMSHPIILHHFEQSPFSEKIRLIFGLKKLAWTSVVISRIMPRPDLMPHAGDADRRRHLLRHPMHHARAGATPSRAVAVARGHRGTCLGKRDVDRPL